MDLVFFISILLLVSVHVWGLMKSKGVEVVLSPLSIYLCFSLFKVVPYGILSYYAPAVIYPPVVVSVGFDAIQETIVKFNFLYVVFTFCLIFSFSALGGFFCQRRFVFATESWTSRFFPSSQMLLRLGGVAAVLFAIKWVSVGGADATILSEELDRGSVTSGLAYVLIPADLSLALCSILAMLRYRSSRSLGDLVLFLIFFLACAFSFSLFGGRKLLLQHVILLVVFWVASGSRLKIISFKMFLVAGLSIFYFLFILDARLTSAEREILFDFGEVALPVGLVTFLSNFSYNDGYYFIVDYFSRNEPLFGRTFLDLLVSPIPSSVYPNKPPVDDGVYVKALMVQHAISFPAAATDFAGLGSIPPETFGNAILNFGWWAVPFFGAILGGIFFLCLKFLSKRSFGFVAIFLVYQSALNFQLSNLRIVGFLTYFVFLSVLWWLARAKLK